MLISSFLPQKTWMLATIFAVTLHFNSIATNVLGEYTDAEPPPGLIINTVLCATQTKSMFTVSF